VQSVTAAVVEGAAADGGQDAPEIEADPPASANLVATASDALAGDVPPAADESRIGLDPDASE
jgi:hypothetical protein